MKMNQQMKTILPLAALALTAASANAATIFSDSFESPLGTGGRVSTTTAGADGLLTGWSRLDTDDLNGDSAVGAADRVGSYLAGDGGDGLGNDEFTTPFGLQAAWVWGGNGGQALVTTGISETVTAGTTYTLTFNYGGDRSTTANYEVYLLGGTEILGSAINSFSGSQTLTLTDSIVFTATAGHAALGETLRIRLDAGPGGIGVPGGMSDFRNDIVYDNVVLTAVAVPEPTTTALLGLGGLALILRRRK
jgi:hypothetical protein